MALWISIGVLFLCVTGLILRPILRPSPADEGISEDDSHLLVYKDQLAEVEKELASGSLSADEAQAMEAEIRRNLLNAARNSSSDSQSAIPGFAKNLAIILCVLLPASSFLLYARLGTPDLPDLPLAGRDTTASASNAIPEQMVKAINALKTELEANPESLEGWVALSRALIATNQPLEAVSALRTALKLAPENIEVKGDLASTLTQASQGVVGPEAESLFGEILKAEPGDPRARYFIGLATAQKDDLRGALAIWRGLEEDSPFDAPWMVALQSSIAAAAQQLDIDPKTIEPQRVRAANRQPSPADVAAIEAMTAEEREALINNMVSNLAARLEEEPENIEGWVRLIRSYGVLGRTEDAAAALNKAKAVPGWSEEETARLDVLSAEMGLGQ